MGLTADLFVANSKFHHIETFPKFELNWWLSCQYDTISRNVAMFYIGFYFFENLASLKFHFLVKALISIPPQKKA